ncbi:MAG: YibE/F family protein [Clostridiales bacterium]|nr:YibE/F family protein [Clostridiales bacterium]
MHIKRKDDLYLKKKLIIKPKMVAVYLITILLSVVYIIVGHKLAIEGLTAFDGAQDTPISYKAKVVQIMSKERQVPLEGVDGDDGGVNIIFTAKILSGEKKGETVTALQQTDPLYPIQMKEAEAGDKVLIYENTDSELNYDWLLGEYVRTDALIVLGILFCIGLLIFGRLKGVNTVISLVFTCLSIFIVFIPAVLSGQNIYMWSIATCIFIIVMTLLIINGADKKSLAAGIGCFSGVAMVGLLTLIMDQIIKLTGMVDDDSLHLYLLNEDRPIDLKAIIFSAIIIGAIGAIMDVSVSIASSLKELQDQVEHVSFGMLLKSGITIGKDMMGTMANTLILAYIGSSLSVTLLLVAYSNSLLTLFNREMIVVEILNALVGSFGILLTIPLTSFICALFYSNHKISRKRPATVPFRPSEEPAAITADVEKQQLEELPEGIPPKPERPDDFMSIDSFRDEENDFNGI